LFLTGKLKTFLFCFSTYDGQELLDLVAGALCPTFFPPGQECTLPLNPGQYGSLVGGPLDIVFGDLPDILSKQTLKKLALKRFSVHSNVYTFLRFSVHSNVYTFLILYRASKKIHWI
jgi:hypothetical protein